jgi:hypothetical protein
MNEDTVLKDWIQQMQPLLTLDLAPPMWQKIAKRFKKTSVPGFGCCYPASEVLYFLAGKKFGFKPAFTKDPNTRGGHWFLKHPDGRIADPTAAQFEGVPFDYSKSRGCGFLTKGLSKRAKILLRRMRAANRAALLQCSSDYEALG